MRVGDGRGRSGSLRRRPPERRSRGSSASLVLLVPVLLLAAPPGSVAQDPEAAELRAAGQALARGAYDEAESLYARLAREGDGPVEAYRGLVRTLTAVGRYGDAEEAARRGLDATGSPDLWTPLGEVLRSTGRLDEAARAFRRADADGARDALEARLNLGLIRFHTGERAAALDTFDGFIDVYNRRRDLSARDLAAVGTAVRRLGRTDPDLFHDALRAYDEAAAADSAYLEARVLAGELFLEKYNSQEAVPEFRAVLDRNPRHPGALLGLARARAFDHDPRAAETARRALETNPRHVPARTFLARLALEVGRWDEARTQVRAALETNPASLEALAVRGALHVLRDDTAAYEETARRFDALYPDDPGLGLAVAELAATHRRYGEAARFAEQAVARDPEAWEAVGLLGLNQLRLGRIDAGRRNLERAFRGDPFNVWFKNTLDLLDTFDAYEIRRTEHFHVVIHGDEAGVLGPYVERLAEEAWESLVRRYGYEPPSPVRLEIFPSHADFSVRTVGLAGMGALGVSFGPVVALDSPTARDPGSFNWASALWHEVAHSVHLGLSRHRVPRWFSEGLAVHDQRAGRAGWGHGPGTGFLRAYDAGRMPAASRLNDGFMRPEFPGQVVLSYYQASLVFQWIEETWGFDAIRRMLEGYGRGLDTRALLERVLELDAETFDARFDAWLRDRFAGPLEAVTGGDGARPPHGARDREALEARVAVDPGDFRARLGLGTLLREAGELEAAAPHLERAVELFPGYAGNDGPHWQLARIREAQGRLREAADHAARLRAVNESHLPGALLEAEALERLDDPVGVARALERAVEIAPFEPDVHRRLAAAYAARGRPGDAVVEREVLVALAPVDRAEAYYELARTRLAAGDVDGARDAVLRALEGAPRFQEALDLLLEIRARRPDPDTTDATGAPR